MDQLTGLIRDLKQTPGRAQSLLKQLLMVLGDVVEHPTEESYRQVNRDELPGVGARLLESCGFLEVAPGTLFLPTGADLSLVHEAYEDISLLLEKAEDGASTTTSASVRSGSSLKPGVGVVDPFMALSAGSRVPVPTVEAGANAAAALKASAESMGPVNPVSLDVAQVRGYRYDKLSACKSTQPKRRGETDQAKELTKTIPPAVQSAAQALTQQLSGKYVHLTAGVRGLGEEAASAAGGAPLPRMLQRGMPAAPVRAQAPAPASAVSAPTQAGRGGGGGGRIQWVSAPPRVTAESRVVVNLPESEFTYIERPWPHFITRWAAMDVELERAFGETAFSLVDLGSCNGYFSLQAAAGYPQSTIVGVEGSVGVGNGTTGVEGTEDDILQTKAIQCHLRWIEKLYLSNNFLAPEVWDYRRVCALAALGRPIADVMLSLSVVHHIDNISTQQYEEAGLDHVEGTVQLMGKLLQLGQRHFVELPDRPWIEHIHDAFDTPKSFLEAAARASGSRWSFVGPLCISVWYGSRELWLLEKVGAQAGAAMPPRGLQSLFPRLLSNKGKSTAAAPSQGPPNRAPLTSSRFIDEGTSAAKDMAPHRAMQPTAARRSPVAAPQPVHMAPAVSLPQRSTRAQAPVRRLTAQELGAALLAAPTALIAAHVQLRDAALSAEVLLRESQSPAVHA